MKKNQKGRTPAAMQYLLPTTNLEDALKLAVSGHHSLEL
jgi:hypothetical protein